MDFWGNKYGRYEFRGVVLYVPVLVQKVCTVQASTVINTTIFQKVIGKLSMKSFYYGIFTVHFRTKVHPRVPFHKPDLRKDCRII